MSRVSATPSRWRRPVLIAVPSAAVFALAATLGFSSVEGYITAKKGDGNNGGYVKCVQRALNNWAKGANEVVLEVDGKFGLKTKNQVFVFQGHEGYGNVDKETSLRLANYMPKGTACHDKLRSSKRYDAKP